MPGALARAILATRLAFFVAGFSLAAWAPLVPFAKANLAAPHGDFGALLLGLGLGATAAMPLAGRFAGPIGPWRLIITGGLGMTLALPVLVLTNDYLPFTIALTLFGASLGVLDIAMNLHALAVEEASGRRMMSNFHAFFSLGGILSASTITFGLGIGISASMAAGLAAGIALACTLWSAPGLLRQNTARPTPLALPRGKVLLIAATAAVAFLADGSVLDWGSLLLIERGQFDVTVAGVGYSVFAVSVTVARLMGDRLTARFGDVRVIQAGGAAAAAGIALLLLASGPGLSMAAFVILGGGLANIFPIMFSMAGRQNRMDPSMAIAAVTMAGYSGIMLGPVLIGMIAGQTSLVAAFWIIAALMVGVSCVAAALEQR
jgi:predicted MFS family arabinose efflux permease